MNSKITMGVRILFGLFCLVFGLNKFIGFMPFPPIPGNGGVLLEIYMTSGFFKIIGMLEILFGIGLIINKFVPLCLTVLVAIMVNAVLFHALHDLANIAGALVGLGLALFLIWDHREGFEEVLAPDIIDN